MRAMALGESESASKLLMIQFLVTRYTPTSRAETAIMATSTVVNDSFKRRPCPR